MPLLVQSISDLKQHVRHWRRAGETIAFVPTMGNLHQGHLHLVEVARRNATRVVASIFVNPLQFAPGTDFETYPRTLEADLAKLASSGVELVFNPDAGSVYPDGINEVTKVSVPGLTEMLCGAFRPGHFDGVATVVAKLFNWVEPDIAIFGEKDFQQLLVIKKMVRDLGFPVSIISGETVRETDGLAMSSRNGYLSAVERKKAAMVYTLLVDITEQLRNSNVMSAEQLRAMEEEGASKLAGQGFKVDYVQIVNEQDLHVAKDMAGVLRVFVAAWLGQARLIDNMKV